MNKVLFSSIKCDWSTPRELFDSLDAIFHFTLDPCASSLNHKCEFYFDEFTNGLIQDWSGNIVFCNPPYGRHLYDWVSKCYFESLKPNTTVVILIPSRTDTKYFHDFILPFSHYFFIRGRLKFGDQCYPAPFPSLIAVFGSLSELANDKLSICLSHKF